MRVEKRGVVIHLDGNEASLLRKILEVFVAQVDDVVHRNKEGSFVAACQQAGFSMPSGVALAADKFRFTVEEL